MPLEIEHDPCIFEEIICATHQDRENPFPDLCFAGAKALRDEVARVNDDVCNATEERDEMQRENEALLEELTKAATEKINSLESRLAAREVEVTQLREALERYGGHQIDCARNMDWHVGPECDLPGAKHPRSPCSCGYAAALSPSEDRKHHVMLEQIEARICADVYTERTRLLPLIEILSSKLTPQDSEVLKQAVAEALEHARET